MIALHVESPSRLSVFCSPYELMRVLTLLEGCEVAVHGSGRTDSGVHAEGQVANVVLRREFTCEKLRAALNGNLDQDIRVIGVEQAPADFHARFSAVQKTYCYRIANAPVMSPFWRRYALHEARPLELERMKSSTLLFLGKHDWTAFSAAQSDVKDRVREISRLEVTERWDVRACAGLLEIRVTADGFLRYMVRSIAGALMAIGRGEFTEEDLFKAIESGNRSRAIVTAPAHGLTLLEVVYPETDRELPSIHE
jgi:tRNA pseudouridine38-40 synthase